MKKDLFKNIISNNQEYLPERESRDLVLPVNSSKIISLIGCRRSGKTSLFYYTIKQLKNTVAAKNIVYINFDDDRLHPLMLSDFQLLLDAYYEMYPAGKKELVWFFFDEIQNIQNWEKFVRRIYDTEKCRIFLTGSSSKLLSNEIATSLRGRTVLFTLYPLSFKEYLQFKKVEINIHSSTMSAIIKNLFEKYLITGGFPELLSENDLQEKILREYIDMIIYKDLIERYNISNIFLIKYMVKYCLSNISTLLSMNKVFNIFKSQGVKVSKNTLYEYFAILEDAMIIYQVPVYSRSIAVQQRNPKKIYSVDIGLKRAVSFESDFGHIFENIVFNELRRKTETIYYYKEEQEVDFLYFDKEQIQLINVCYDIETDQTRKRELNGLFGAMKNLKIKKATLITSYSEEIIKEGKMKIQITPLWKWLLINN